MPIYEYRCDQCNENFEKMVKLNTPVPDCPACGATDVRKLVSAASFVLKGGGWYRDHYGLKDSATSSSTSADSGDSSASGGGETSTSSSDSSSSGGGDS